MVYHMVSLVDVGELVREYLGITGYLSFVLHECRGPYWGRFFGFGIQQTF